MINRFLAIPGAPRMSGRSPFRRLHPANIDRSGLPGAVKGIICIDLPGQ